MCSRRMTGQHWHSVGLVWEVISSSLVQVYQWHHLQTASTMTNTYYMTLSITWRGSAGPATLSLLENTSGINSFSNINQ